MSKTSWVTPPDWAYGHSDRAPHKQSEEGRSDLLILEKHGCWNFSIYGRERFDTGRLLLTPLMAGLFDLSATNPSGHYPRQPLYSHSDPYRRFVGSVFRLSFALTAFDFTFGEVTALIMAKRLNSGIVSNTACAVSPVAAFLYAALVIEEGRRRGTEYYDSLKNTQWTLTLMGPVNEEVASDWRGEQPSSSLPHNWGYLAHAIYVPTPKKDEETT